jgi:hypothetical protein
VHPASIFRVKEPSNEQTASKASWQLASLTLQPSSCKQDVPSNFYPATRRYISEDNTLHIHRDENLESNNLKIIPSFRFYLQGKLGFMEVYQYLEIV